MTIPALLITIIFRKNSPCFGEQMAYATPKNVKTILKEVDEVKAEGLTNYSPALNMAFDFLYKALKCDLNETLKRLKKHKFS